MFTYFRLFTIIGFALASCGPRDVAQEGNNSVTANGGKPVVISNTGERSPTCPAKFTDEMSLRSPVESDSKVFAGKITASLSAGDRNCFRIGAVVNLQNGKQGPVRGQVTVTKVEIMAVESLSSSHAQALGLDQSTMTAFANEEMEKAKDTFNPKGMVNVTHFKFNGGTVVDNGGGSTITDIVTIDKEGERPQTCPVDFKNSNRLIVAESQNTDVFAKKITAVMDAGDRNCFKIGTEVSLHNSKEGSPIGKVKIVKVQIVPVTKLDKNHGKALGIEEKSLKTAAEEKIASVKFDALGLVHITYFNLIEGDGTTPPPTPIPAIDESKYIPLIPTLKAQLSEKLSAVLKANAIDWDPATLEITYASAVNLLSNNSAERGTFPAFRVNFKTAKGSPFALYNSEQGTERLLVMDSEIADNDVVDFEGNIISKKSLWTSLEQDFAPLGLLIVNTNSGKAPGFSLDATFKPLVIDVTAK